MALADIVRQLAFYQSGGRENQESDLDKFNKILGTVSGGVDGYSAGLKAKGDAQAKNLANQKTQLEVEGLKREQTTIPTYREPQVQSPIEQVNAGEQNRAMFENLKKQVQQSLPNATFPEPAASVPQAPAAPAPLSAEDQRRQKFGGMTLGEAKTWSEIEAKQAAANSPTVYVNPANTSEISFTPINGWLPVQPKQALNVSAQNERSNTRISAAEKRTRAYQNFQLARDKTKQDIDQQKVPADKAGLYTLANESIAGIENAKDILFPGGTPESFDRLVAAKTMTKATRAFDQDSQDIYRYLGNALAARQLIQTGVAARQDEAEGLVDRFVANVTSDPNSAYRALGELQNFYQNYNNTLITKRPNPVGTGLNGVLSNPNVPEELKNKARMAMQKGIPEAQVMQALQKDLGGLQ